MNRILASLPVLLLGVLFSSTPVGAQTRLIPQVGLYASVSDLGTVDTSDGVRTVGEQDTSLAYGLSLDLSSAKTLGFRITALYGSDSEIPVEGVGCTAEACALRSTLLAVSGGVALRPFPVSSPLRPYFLAGGGMKRYGFELEPESQLKDAFSDESRATGVLGLGFDWNLGILKGNVELTDYISGSFLEDGDRQHDFFLTVGLVLG